MKTTTDADRKLADLPQRVEKLEPKAKLVAKGNWREAFGFAKDDPMFREAMRLGAEWREKANKEDH